MAEQGSAFVRPTIAVFSFNRADSLRNCVASLERMAADCPIVIIDDNSDCPHTVEALSQIGQRHPVLRPTGQGSQSLGGLYGGMTAAVAQAEQAGGERIFFLQDDMQVVRRLDQAFWESCETMFAADPRVAQINAVFFRAWSDLPQSRARLRIRQDVQAYEDTAYGLCDTGLLHIPRFRQNQLSFGPSEGEANARAKAKGLVLLNHRDPVCMFTPWPRTHRRDRPLVNFLKRLNDWGVGAGCHPFIDMDAEMESRLLDRPIEHFPIAEAYLKTKTRLKAPWWYTMAYDSRKLRNLRDILSLRWIFDGPCEYRKLVSEINKSLKK